MRAFLFMSVSLFAVSFVNFAFAGIPEDINALSKKAVESIDSSVRKGLGNVVAPRTYHFNTVIGDICKQLDKNDHNVFKIEDLRDYADKINHINIFQHSVPLDTDEPAAWGDHSRGFYDPNGTRLLLIVTFKDMSSLTIKLTGVDPAWVQAMYANSTSYYSPILELRANSAFFDDVVFGSKGPAMEPLDKSFKGRTLSPDPKLAAIGLADVITVLGQFEFTLEATRRETQLGEEILIRHMMGCMEGSTTFLPGIAGGRAREISGMAATTAYGSPQISTEDTRKFLKESSPLFWNEEKMGIETFVAPVRARDVR